MYEYEATVRNSVAICVRFGHYLKHNDHHSLPWKHFDIESKALFIHLPLCEFTSFVLHCIGNVLGRINSL